MTLQGTLADHTKQHTERERVAQAVRQYMHDVSWGMYPVDVYTDQRSEWRLLDPVDVALLIQQCVKLGYTQPVMRSLLNWQYMTQEQKTAREIDVYRIVDGAVSDLQWRKLEGI